MSDADRVVVRTYVPEHQKEVWAEDAAAMGMSQSEFVRSMVQAGRRGFDLGDADIAQSGGREEPPSGHVTPRGEELEDRVLGVLDSEEVAGWDELVAALSNGFEERLETAVANLEDEGVIRFAPRNGGYTRRGDE